jgi:2-polyprenyl-6-methoxyphenol hydroxylase-like FAD-dependent oxidoreductase
VIGGSVAGLVAARILSDHFARVTVVERDPRPEGPHARKGAPQMRHVHALLDAAARGLEEMFPGFIEELRSAGALTVDAASGSASHQYGAWKPRFKAGFDFLFASRPLIEWQIRRRVQQLPSVQILYERAVEELIASTSRDRVTGVRVRGAEGEAAISADLVVDAAGRGTRVPRWLEALGYGRPEEQEVGIDLAYVSRLYERPKDFAGDWSGLVVAPRSPGRRGCFLLDVEGGRWLASMTGLFGDHCPMHEEGFLEFARSLPVPDVYEALKAAAPLSETAMYKIPSSRWFHYEKMKRLPDGLVMIGDSVCVLNPLYGQGITVTIQSARELAVALDERSQKRDLGGLPRAFQKRLAGVVGMSWMVSTIMDLASPEAKGERPPGIGALQWIFSNLIDMTSRDEKACKIFYDVLHARRGPGALLLPDMLFPLVAHCVKSPFLPLEARINTGPIPRAPLGSASATRRRSRST